MIQSFRHKGLKIFFSIRFGGGHSVAARETVADAIGGLGYGHGDYGHGHSRIHKLHLLKGQRKGRWSIWVNANWRVTFEFRDGHAYLLDYGDYH